MIYDFIVIGSGFGGSVASLRLAEKGYSVLTIEQGKRFNPTDFPKTNWKKSLFGGKMKIDNRGHKKVPAFIPIGQEVMERYARKVSGIPQNILLEVFFNRPTTAHILGGSQRRMPA